MRYIHINILFLGCVSIAAMAMDNKSAIELKLIMAIDHQTTKIPFYDELLSIPSLIERYKQNETHPFGKIMAYVLQQNAVVKIVGKIALLPDNILQGLASRKALFISYVSNQDKKLTYALLTDTCTMRDVNLLKKYLEDRQIPQETKPVAQKSQDELDGMLRQHFPEGSVDDMLKQAFPGHTFPEGSVTKWDTLHNMREKTGY